MSSVLLFLLLLAMSFFTICWASLADFLFHGLRRPTPPRGWRIALWVRFAAAPLSAVGPVTEVLRHDAYWLMVSTGFLVGLSTYATVKVGGAVRPRSWR